MVLDYETEVLSDNSSILNSLGALAAVRVLGTRRLTLIESDFVMADIELHASLQTSQADSLGAQHTGPYLLCLHDGVANDADVAAMLNGTDNYDRSPTTGEDPQAAKRARNAQLLLIIPFMLMGINSDSASDLTFHNYEAHYEGPPLRKKSGVKTWTFPRQRGWTWSLFNGGGVMNSSQVLSIIARYKGVWRD